MANKAPRTAVSGNTATPTKMRDNPPKLPSLAPRLHGMPPPIKVRITDGLGAVQTPSPNQPTGGSRGRHRSRGTS